ncbi:MAG: tripartite tricarboxylate transporter substrate binding protein [Deltaproteobacteria bacterium]
MRRNMGIALSILICSTCFLLGIAQAAEKYPVKPIEFIVPMEAGSDGDTISRPAMARVSQILGQPIMFINKPGGGSSIGYRETLRAKPDGYTMGWGSATLVSNKLQGISNFDYRDFIPLGPFATYFPVVVASNNSKHNFKTIQEVLTFAKANPNEISMAVAGVGQNWWVAAMDFVRGTGVQINMIPQPGTGAMCMAQVAGGHTDLTIVALGAAKSMVDSGQVRMLANLGEKRAGAPYEQIPTMRELGYNVGYESLNFAMAPPKVPKEIVDVWVKALKTAVSEPSYVKFCGERNARWEYMTPEQITAAFDKRKEVMREIMAKAGILKEAN